MTNEFRALQRQALIQRLGGAARRVASHLDAAALSHRLLGDLRQP